MTLINGNALHIPLADGSVQCVVTSPPYWGLRDYGISDQLGLEQTPDEYVANMVAVFREVWRVLRDDGTVWLNLGDSYATKHAPGTTDEKTGWKHGEISQDYQGRTGGAGHNGIKAKDLIGIPWRVALALQADGWYLRNDIIWAKPNPMPESVKDRCTKSHEYIFLLTKSKKYFYDNHAIKEPHAEASLPRALRGVSKNNKYKDGAPGSTAHTMSQPRKNVRKEWEEKQGGGGSGFDGHSGYYDENGRLLVDPAGRNKRTVWTVSTKPYSGAHYATFPPDLIDDCIKAGTSEKGKCPECGEPWKRVLNTVSAPDRGDQAIRSNMVGVIPGRDKECRMNSVDMESIVYEEIGWEPTCDHKHDAVPCLVFDPFVGSGTTVMVARDLGRKGIGTDLSLDYLIDNARKRLSLDKLDNWINYESREVETDLEGLPLFSEDEKEKDHKNMRVPGRQPHSFHKARLEKK